jgi:hypothetical protein
MRMDSRMISADLCQENGKRSGASWCTPVLGEALRHRPHMDNAAVVEAMGSHFEPDSTGWKWPDHNRQF